MNQLKNILPIVLVVTLLTGLTIQVSAQKGGGGHRESVKRGDNARPSNNVRPSHAYNDAARPQNNIRPVNNYHPVANNARPIGPNNYRPVGYRPNYGYYNHGYYGRVRFPFIHYGPSFGFRCSILPFGFYGFYIGGYPYYYYEGIYYRPYQNGGYEVIAPPLGARVTRLPRGARVRIIDGQKYYELGGTFYQEEISADNEIWYVVVGTDGVLNTGNNQEAAPESTTPPANQNQPAPVPPAVQDNTDNLPVPAPGTKLTELPAGSKAVVINQQKFYESPDGVYYQEVIEGDHVSYQVVGNATDKP
jgi:hypothetical protein